MDDECSVDVDSWKFNFRKFTSSRVGAEPLSVHSLEVQRETK